MRRSWRANNAFSFYSRLLMFSYLFAKQSRDGKTAIENFVAGVRGLIGLRLPIFKPFDQA